MVLDGPARTNGRKGEPKMERTERILLRAGEAAELLAIGRSTLYELAAKGIIPTVRVGQSLRFSREQLIDWIKGQLDSGVRTEPCSHKR